MNDELRAITKNQRSFDSAVVMSSLMPSEKYAWLGSSLILLKGSTAIAGRSGKDSGEGARSAAISEGRPVAFRADPAGGYWLDRQHYPLVTAAGPTAKLRLAVADGAPIAFFPSGGSSGGRIRIEAAGGWRDIDVDAVTGRAVLRP